MLIIFDLDDTLIDTSGCITPIKLEDALRRMIASGLSVLDFSESLALLRRLDRSSESARCALSEFIEISGADPALLEVAIAEIYHNVSPDMAVSALEGAVDLLSELAGQHQLALVTVGDPNQQHAKMKKAGIDSAIFSKIVVSQAPNKKPHYQAIVEELGYMPNSVVVCGDRIERDLKPGRELGFKTVHMRWGRGRNMLEKSGDVDHTISSLCALKEIVGGQ